MKSSPTPPSALSRESVSSSSHSMEVDAPALDNDANGDADASIEEELKDGKRKHGKRSKEEKAERKLRKAKRRLEKANLTSPSSGEPSSASSFGLTLES